MAIVLADHLLRHRGQTGATGPVPAFDPAGDDAPGRMRSG
jgi:hypothetical protein